MAVKHKFHSPKSDEADETVVRPSDWNDDHEGGGVESNPPSGKCKVTNLYVDPITEKLVVEYESQPV